MSEAYSYPIGPNGTCHAHRYARDEFRAIWRGEVQGQGSHDVRKPHEPSVVRLPVQDEETALRLAALFVRHVFAIPTCTWWSGGALRLYCGDAGSGRGECMLRAEALPTRLDEPLGLAGRLFADDPLEPLPDAPSR